MADRHRVEAGKKGAEVMWAKRRKREATTAARMAMERDRGSIETNSASKIHNGRSGEYPLLCY